MNLYTVEQTSALIHKKPTIIYKDLARRPHALPPVHRLPNCHKVFFRDVEAWMRGELPIVVQRILDWKMTAKNALAFHVMFVSEQSGESLKKGFEIQKQLDGSWLLSRP